MSIESRSSPAPRCFDHGHESRPSRAGAIAYGGKNGVGASIAVNIIDTHAFAYVSGSDIAASGNVVVSAETDAQLVAITATIGAGNKGMAIAGSLSVNVVLTETHAYVSSRNISGIDAVGSVAITAKDTSDIALFAGNVAFSFKAMPHRRRRHDSGSRQHAPYRWPAGSIATAGSPSQGEGRRDNMQMARWRRGGGCYSTQNL